MPAPVFDPTLPKPNQSPASSLDMRNQFNALYNLIQQLQSIRPSWFDHFLGSSLDIKYTLLDFAFGGSPGGAEILNEVNGVLIISTGGTSGSESGVQLGNISFKQFDPTVPFWIECKLSRYDTSTLLAVSFRDKNVGDPSCANGIFCIVDPATNSGKFYLEVLKNNVGTIIDSGVAPSSPGTYDTIRMEFDGTFIKLFINSVLTLTSSASIPVVALIPSIYVYQNGGNASKVKIDYIGWGLL